MIATPETKTHTFPVIQGPARFDIMVLLFQNKDHSANDNVPFTLEVKGKPMKVRAFIRSVKRADGIGTYFDIGGVLHGGNSEDDWTAEFTIEDYSMETRKGKATLKTYQEIG